MDEKQLVERTEVELMKNTKTETPPFEKDKPRMQTTLHPSKKIRGWMYFSFLIFGIVGAIPAPRRAEVDSPLMILVVMSYVAFLCSIVAVFTYRFSRKNLQIKLNEEVSTSHLEAERFVLYLRPFSTSGRLQVQNTLPSTLDRSIMGPWWDFEFLLSLATESRFTLVAIGHCDKSVGSAKILATDDEWQNKMQELADRAAFIVMVPLDRPATLWEFKYILSRPKLKSKTLFVLPRTHYRIRFLFNWLGGKSIKKQWHSVQQKIASHNISIPAYTRKGLYFTLTDDGQFHLIPTDNFSISQLQQVTKMVEEGNPGTLYDKLDFNRLARKSEKVKTSSVMAPLISLFVILAIKDWIVEPFQMPSGSMHPTLQAGDFFLVNKLIYNWKLPERADVMVFFPPHKKVHFVKRVIGLPGDYIEYHDKTLFINGEEMPINVIAELPTGQPTIRLATEQIGAVEHGVQQLLQRFNTDTFSVKVMPNHYFVMGDNRDNSQDSRVWGQVPEQNIEGKASLIWMHWDDFRSLPTFGRSGMIK